jgi:hypothetical protein
MGLVKSPKAAAAVAEEDDDDEDDEDDDEEDDEEDEDDEDMEDEDDDEDEDEEDEEDDEEDDEDEDDDEDEEEEEAPAPGKRKAGGMALPDPKKTKGAAAPAGSPKGGSEEDKYAARVADFIKKNGPTAMAMVGNKVPKGNNVPKLGQFFKNRTEFVVDGKGLITLKK